MGWNHPSLCLVFLSWLNMASKFRTIERWILRICHRSLESYHCRDIEWVNLCYYDIFDISLRITLSHFLLVEIIFCVQDHSLIFLNTFLKIYNVILARTIEVHNSKYPGSLSSIGSSTRFYINMSLESLIPRREFIKIMIRHRDEISRLLCGYDKIYELCCSFTIKKISCNLFRDVMDMLSFFLSFW